MQAPFTALLFDMDGLMIDTESVSGDAWRLAAEEVGQPIDEALILGMVGLSVHKCVDFIAGHFQDRSLAETLSASCRRHYRRLLAHGELRVKPGIFDVLQWAEDTVLPGAVATSTQRELCDLKLARTGLQRFFRHTVAGDEVANTKPAPDIYLAAAALLDVAPAQCVVLEDSVYGVRAAQAAGMRVIMVPDILTPTSEDSAGTLAVCHDLHQALSLLKQLRG